MQHVSARKISLNLLCVCMCIHVHMCVCACVCMHIGHVQVSLRVYEARGPPESLIILMTGPSDELKALCFDEAGWPVNSQNVLVLLPSCKSL